MKKIVAASMFAVFATFSGSSGIVNAQSAAETKAEVKPEEKAAEAEPMALRKIMKDLDVKMQAITSGISREDWETVEKSAAFVGDHPQPPFTEKLRIMSFFGTDMGRFKENDTKTHDAGNLLVEAAKKKDAEAAIGAFQKLQMGCYGCHRDFRKKFIEHFYEGK